MQQLLILFSFHPRPNDNMTFPFSPKNFCCNFVIDLPFNWGWRCSIEKSNCPFCNSSERKDTKIGKKVIINVNLTFYSISSYQTTFLLVKMKKLEKFFAKNNLFLHNKSINNNWSSRLWKGNFVLLPQTNQMSNLILNLVVTSRQFNESFICIICSATICTWLFLRTSVLNKINLRIFRKGGSEAFNLQQNSQ